MCIRRWKARSWIDFPGPFTFGEIAYQLMNQTLVSLEVP